MSTPVTLTPSGKKLVTLILGDGVGPEVVRSTQRIIEASGAAIEWEEQEAGAAVFKRGLPSGVPDETIVSIMKTRVALKGPLETPIGFGEKSANVTLRKLFETYGNIRPVRELPNVKTPYSGRGIDLVVVRENVEDLYAGIEYMQTPGVAECLKLISRKGCEKIVRLAFEVARAEGRKRVHCATKANIMKMTEGTMKRVFEQIAPEYPDIEAQHIIVDNCAHQLVKKPEQFDVLVTTNMNGDILSDLTSGLIGGLGFAPSANLGREVAIFEAVHGSAPKYAGKNTINPTAMLMAGIMMLRHLGEFEAASQIENAILVTLASGVATRDVVGDEAAASTSAYTDAIIANLGKRAEGWQTRDYKAINIPQLNIPVDSVRPRSRRVIGVDIFVESAESAEELGAALTKLVAETPVYLKLISNRGTRVYPPTGALTDNADHWRCRFMLRDDQGALGDATLYDILQRVGADYRWMHIEKLQAFDGVPGFTKDQGED
ncbi:MAG TPA: NADP-dependent isocitrate dehydrogenase [Ktedonobacterales bacterium]|nr:NADP-dependent isocitrate dehydrogenase [Ktedonobacterales bacterium]